MKVLIYIALTFCFSTAMASTWNDLLNQFGEFKKVRMEGCELSLNANGIALKAEDVFGQIVEVDLSSQISTVKVRKDEAKISQSVSSLSTFILLNLNQNHLSIQTKIRAPETRTWESFATCTVDLNKLYRTQKWVQRPPTWSEWFKDNLGTFVSGAIAGVPDPKSNARYIQRAEYKNY